MRPWKGPLSDLFFMRQSEILRSQDTQISKLAACGLSAPGSLDGPCGTYYQLGPDTSVGQYWVGTGESMPVGTWGRDNAESESAWSSQRYTTSTDRTRGCQEKEGVLLWMQKSGGHLNWIRSAKLILTALFATRRTRVCPRNAQSWRCLNQMPLSLALKKGIWFHPNHWHWWHVWNSGSST